MLVVNGDSFVHEFHLPKEKRWSTRIKADVNLGLGAGSNDRIFYTTLQLLHEKDVDIIIIGWTSWVRSFLQKNNGSRWKICSGIATDELEDHLGEDPLIADLYYKKIFNEYTQLKNTLMYMLHLQEYCKMKNIKLINFSTIFGKNDLNENELEKIAKSAHMSRDTMEMKNNGIQHHKNVLKEYINKLDSSTWVNKSLFFSMNQILDQYPRTSDGHIAEEGSKYWAEIVQKFIDQT